jgi:hypothetical protein
MHTVLQSQRGGDLRRNLQTFAVARLTAVPSSSLAERVLQHDYATT